MSARIPRGTALAATFLVLTTAVLPLPAHGQVASAPWGTYIGGAGDERITAMQESGEKIVAVGTTFSRDFAPTPVLGTRATQDIFVARFDEDDRPLANSPSVFEGNGEDEPLAFTTSEGDVYIVGRTRSSSFTNVGIVPSTSYQSGDDAFLAKLNEDGTPAWFMYLRGNGNDVATGVVISGGAAYVTGTTTSTDFLGTPTAPGGEDGFVVKVNLTTPPAFAWPAPKLIGGTSSDQLSGSVLDLQNLLVVGTTRSVFPHGASIVLNSPRGTSGSDAFVGSLDTVTGNLQWLAYVGGALDDMGRAITVAPTSRDIVVTGATRTPLRSPPPNPLDLNAFVARLSVQAEQPRITIRLKEFGGSSDDEALSVAVDSQGTTYVGGKTASNDFPTSEKAFDRQIESGSTRMEGFLAAFPAAGGGGWASFVGGAQPDEVSALSSPSSIRLVVGLKTSSQGLPAAPVPPSDPSMSGPSDGYLAVLDIKDPNPPLTVSGKVNDRPQKDDVPEDVDTQTSRTSISANWSGFSDPSGIAKYEWAIGTQENPEEQQPFTSVGLETSATSAKPLNLTSGITYYVTLRIEDAYGMTITYPSDGVLVTDPSDPDGGPGEPDGGPGENDGGTDPDGGTGTPDGGPGDNEEEDAKAPLGWGCASSGGAALPLLLGLIVLVLLTRRLGASSR